MSRIAVIDIGTNSVKLTVAEQKLEGLEIIRETSRSTRLGKGVDQAGSLQEDAMQRTLDAVKAFADEARALGAARIAGTGSSALRDAGNGQEFLDRARRQAGVEVEIIAGAREAELAYKSVAGDSSLGIDGGTALVFDIGGGSTELICGANGQMAAHASYNVGAVRLTERYLKADPPTADEYAQAKADAKKALSPFAACGQSISLVGIGGTPVNVASVAHKGAGEVHGAQVSRDLFLATADELKRLPLEQRRAVPGIEPERADIILGGIAVLEQILDQFHADAFRVSVRGMRYGLLLELSAQ